MPFKDVKKGKTVIPYLPIRPSLPTQAHIPAPHPPLCPRAPRRGPVLRDPGESPRAVPEVARLSLRRPRLRPLLRSGGVPRGAGTFVPSPRTEDAGRLLPRVFLAFSTERASSSAPDSSSLRAGSAISDLRAMGALGTCMFGGLGQNFPFGYFYILFLCSSPPPHTHTHLKASPLPPEPTSKGRPVLCDSHTRSLSGPFPCHRVPLPQLPLAEPHRRLSLRGDETLTLRCLSGGLALDPEVTYLGATCIPPTMRN